MALEQKGERVPDRLPQPVTITDELLLLCLRELRGIRAELRRTHAASPELPKVRPITRIGMAENDVVERTGR